MHKLSLSSHHLSRSMLNVDMVNISSKKLGDDPQPSRQARKKLSTLINSLIKYLSSSHLIILISSTFQSRSQLFDKLQATYAHSAFFYVELLCNVWFIIELFVRFLVSVSLGVCFYGRKMSQSQQQGSVCSHG